MRPALHLLLIALLAATHLWGGCLSCPKFFMFPWEQAASTGKHCCQKGECERNKDNSPLQKECTRVAFDRTPEPSVDVDLSVLPFEMHQPLPLAPLSMPVTVTDWVDPPPIDRQALLTSFLI